MVEFHDIAWDDTFGGLVPIDDPDYQRYQATFDTAFFDPDVGYWTRHDARADIRELADFWGADFDDIFNWRAWRREHGY